ncbi:unnamed protein product [Prunus brigantina]
MIKTHFNLTIRQVHTDNETEFFNHTIQKKISSIGLIHQHSRVATPQALLQNNPCATKFCATKNYSSHKPPCYLSDYTATNLKLIFPFPLRFNMAPGTLYPIIYLMTNSQLNIKVFLLLLLPLLSLTLLMKPLNILNGVKLCKVNLLP